MHTKYEVLKYANMQRKKGDNIFLLLDGAADPSVFAAIFEYEGTKDYIPLFLQTPFVSVLQQGPLLVHINTPSPLFNWFWEIGTPLHAGVLVFSSQKIQPLCEQLKPFLQAKSPVGAKVVLRFYDPRVTPWALSLMKEDELAAFSNNISSILLPRKNMMGIETWTNVLDKGANNG